MSNIIENEKVYELIYSIGHLGNMNEHIIKSSENIDSSFNSIVINNNRESRSYFGRQLMTELGLNDTEFTNIWCYVKHMSISYIHNIELIEKYSYEFKIKETEEILNINKSYLETLDYIILNIKEKTTASCSECEDDLKVNND